MSIESVQSLLMSEETLPVAEKLLEATYKQQEINAINMSNWMIPGATKVELSSDFEAQFKQLLAAGDYEGVSNLEASTQQTEKPIEYQGVMQQVKDNQLNHQFLTQVLSDSYKQIEMAINVQG